MSSHGVTWCFLGVPSSLDGATSDRFEQACEGSLPFVGLVVIAPVIGRTVLDHGDASPATISTIPGGVARTRWARPKPVSVEPYASSRGPLRHARAGCSVRPAYAPEAFQHRCSCISSGWIRPVRLRLQQTSTMRSGSGTRCFRSTRAHLYVGHIWSVTSVMGTAGRAQRSWPAASETVAVRRRRYPRARSGRGAQERLSFP